MRRHHKCKHCGHLWINHLDADDQWVPCSNGYPSCKCPTFAPDSHRFKHSKRWLKQHPIQNEDTH